MFTMKSKLFSCVVIFSMTASYSFGADVAQIGKAKYSSLKAAITAVPTNGGKTIINVLNNITTNECLCIENNRNVEINLNGHSITMTANNYVLNPKKQSTLTISGKGTIANTAAKPKDADSRYIIRSEKGSTVIINGGTYDTNCNSSAFHFEGNATIENIKLTNKSSNGVTAEGNANLTINNCEINAAEMYSICFNSTGKLTIKNGTYTTAGNAEAISLSNGTSTLTDVTVLNNCTTVPQGNDYRRAIYTAADAKLNISGGTFKANSTAQTIYLKGITTINNATIANDDNCAVIIRDAKDVTINNCHLTANSDRALNFNSNGTLTINGGTFTSNGNSSVVSIYGTAHINNAVMTNNCESVKDYDLRRIIFSEENSSIHIKGGEFKMNAKTSTGAFGFNGTAVIENATIISGGKYGVYETNNGDLTLKNSKVEAYNGAAIRFASTGKLIVENCTLCNNSNNATIAVKSGSADIRNATAINSCASFKDKDERCALWTEKETTVSVTGGSYEANTSDATLCLNGNTTINSGTFINTNAEGYVAYQGTVNGGKFKGSKIFNNTIATGNSILCSVNEGFIANEFYGFVPNTKADTKGEYPYTIAYGVMEDGRNYTAKTDTDIKGALRYNRSFTEDWQPLYVPFDIPAESLKGFQVAESASCDGNTLNIRLTTDVKANGIYFIKADKAGKQTITVNNAKVKAATANKKAVNGYTFTGTNSNIEAGNRNTKWWSCTDGNELVKGNATALSAQRWYMEGSKGSETIKITVDSSATTAIANINADDSANTATYNLMGQRQFNATRGIVIRNGKKYSVK